MGENKRMCLTWAGLFLEKLACDSLHGNDPLVIESMWHLCNSHVLNIMRSCSCPEARRLIKNSKMVQCQTPTQQSQCKLHSVYAGRGISVHFICSHVGEALRLRNQRERNTPTEGEDKWSASRWMMGLACHKPWRCSSTEKIFQTECIICFLAFSNWIIHCRVQINRFLSNFVQTVSICFHRNAWMHVHLTKPNGQPNYLNFQIKGAKLMFFYCIISKKAIKVDFEKNFYIFFNAGYITLSTNFILSGWREFIILFMHATCLSVLWHMPVLWPACPV